MCIEYVLQISNQLAQRRKWRILGETVFEENCAGCHGDVGHGGYENGAPSLTDTAWIYGSSRADIADTLHNGRPWGRARMVRTIKRKRNPPEIHYVSDVVGRLMEPADQNQANGHFGHSSSLCCYFMRGYNMPPRFLCHRRLSKSGFCYQIQQERQNERHA